MIELSLATTGFAYNSEILGISIHPHLITMNLHDILKALFLHN
jgi:hypothetical protein